MVSVPANILAILLLVYAAVYLTALLWGAIGAKMIYYNRRPDQDPELF